MAEVFDYIDGEEIERVIAREKTVQKELKKELAKAYVKATADMKSHRDTGNAHISWSKGDIDYYLELNDPPTFTRDDAYAPGAALAIEINLGILRKATGLIRE